MSKDRQCLDLTAAHPLANTVLLTHEPSFARQIALEEQLPATALRAALYTSLRAQSFCSSSRAHATVESEDEFTLVDFEFDDDDVVLDFEDEDTGCDELTDTCTAQIAQPAYTSQPTAAQVAQSSDTSPASKRQTSMQSFEGSFDGDDENDNIYVEDTDLIGEQWSLEEDTSAHVDSHIGRHGDRVPEGEHAGVLSRIALLPHKAGMDGIDKSKVNAVILEASKNSRFFQREMQKDAETQRKIERMLKQRDAMLQTLDTSLITKHVDAEIRTLEEQRDLSRCYVHVDMDAFYAAVEIRDNPSLAGKPLGIGGMGMLCTASYEARKFGVRSAMPGFIAVKLCPDLILVKPNFPVYRQASQQVKDILGQYDPRFIAMSLDEAYLDLTQYLRTLQKAHADPRAHVRATVLATIGADTLQRVLPPDGDVTLPELVVWEMRARICDCTKLTASAGIAPNRTLAKICSDLRKPNNQYFLPPTRDAVMALVNPLSIRKIPGIGKVSERLLSALQIQTCSDLRKQLPLLSKLFLPTSYSFFLRASLGIHYMEMHSDARKSVSLQRTFGRLEHPDELRTKCREICMQFAQQLKEEQTEGKTVGLILKSVDFEHRVKSASLGRYISSLDDLLKVVLPLLDKEIAQGNGRLPLRLMGVRLSLLREARPEAQHAQPQITKFLTAGTRTDNTRSVAPRDEPTSSTNTTTPRADAMLDSEATSVDVVSGYKEQLNAASSSNQLAVLQEELGSRCTLTSFFATARAPRNIGETEPPAKRKHVDVFTEQESEGLRTTLPHASTEFVHVDVSNGSPTPPTAEQINVVSASSSMTIAASERVHCPVCNGLLPTDNAAMNQHLDACLNRGTIRSLLQESMTAPRPAQPAGNTAPSLTASSSTKQAISPASRSSTPKRAKGPLDAFVVKSK